MHVCGLCMFCQIHSFITWHQREAFLVIAPLGWGGGEGWLVLHREVVLKKLLLSMYQRRKNKICMST